MSVLDDLDTRPAPARTRWSAICAATALRPGQALALHVGGEPVAVFRTCDGEWFALGDRTLAGGTLAFRRDLPVVVAASGARYDLASGACVDGGEAVRAFPVRVVDGAVEIALTPVRLAAA